MAKQETLTGMEDIYIPAIDLAMEDYQDLKENRMKFLARELEAKEVVHNLLKQHKLTKYRYDSLIAEIVKGDEKVAVKRLKEKVEEDRPEDIVE